MNYSNQCCAIDVVKSIGIGLTLEAEIRVQGFSASDTIAITNAIVVQRGHWTPNPSVHRYMHRQSHMHIFLEAGIKRSK